VKTTYKILLAAAVISMTGCATNSDHSEYRAALQKVVDQKMTSAMGGTGLCLPVSSSSNMAGDAYIAHECQKQTPKGYDFSMAQDAPKDQMQLMDELRKKGYVKFGSPYTCHYQSGNLFTGTTNKNKTMLPVATTNKDVRFVQHQVAEFLMGDVDRGSLCIGHFDITKIVSATTPHFNSKYSMKTVAVTADIGLKGVMRLGKNSPLLKNALKSDSGDADRIRKDIFTISAILGESSKDHWKVMQVTHFGPAQKTASASS
jgi:hypothetical protein